MSNTIKKTNDFKIHFELVRELDKVALWGSEEPHSIHWFGLTDGLLWITVGDQTLYEYSDEAREYFEEDIRYNDYQLAQFLQDFSEICGAISESLPEELYNLVDNLDEFHNQLHKWYKPYNDTEEAFWTDFFENQWVKVCNVSDSRIVDASHLTGGLGIWFFRHKDKLKIIWDSHPHSGLEINPWTSPRGIVELPYDTFVKSVYEFFDAFFVAMDQQVENALARDWGKVELDKEQLAKEHPMRKETFYKDLAFLKNPSTQTNWDEVLFYYKKMKKDLGIE